MGCPRVAVLITGLLVGALEWSRNTVTLNVDRTTFYRALAWCQCF